MKKIDINKYKADLMQKFAFDFKEWMSPAIRDYYSLFIKNAHNNRAQLMSWIKEYSVLEDGQSIKVAQKPIQVSVEARELFLTLQTQIGEEVHVGDWYTITQDRVDQFSNVTEDHQWLHNDVERAEKESPFKTTIAHGFLTLSLLPRLTDSVDASRPAYPNAKMTVNYGLNQVRFPYPVKTGSVIRAHSRLIKVSPIKRGLEIEKEISIEIQGTRRPGCVAVSVVRVYF
ncbi:MaoC family dehydratase [Psychromonas sp. RZ22]|uniref:MaoC family dehydratase n=1 Tax=Psychromonas algarum TaxID=2555643 RepID=UPI0010674A3E|nr:MaoC family dehydratase [Psychromonas sp. RZ22]TEW56709.1 MaoC family dehydratase [Psychromonas sp. RZ22]